MRVFWKSAPNRDWQALKLFGLILWGLNLPVGSDTPQKKLLHSIRTRRTKSCEVSDPMELSPVGFQTQQNNGRGCVHRLADACSTGPDTWQSPVGDQTPRNKVFLGIKPREQLLNTRYLREFKTEFQHILGCEFGAYIGLIYEKKNQRPQFSYSRSFKQAVLFFRFKEQCLKSCVLPFLLY